MSEPTTTAAATDGFISGLMNGASRIFGGAQYGTAQKIFVLVIQKLEQCEVNISLVKAKALRPGILTQYQFHTSFIPSLVEVLSDEKCMNYSQYQSVAQDVKEHFRSQVATKIANEIAHKILDAKIEVPPIPDSAVAGSTHAIPIPEMNKENLFKLVSTVVKDCDLGPSQPATE